MDICVFQGMKLMLHLVPLLLMVSLSAVQPKVPLNNIFAVTVLQIWYMGSGVFSTPGFWIGSPILDPQSIFFRA
jgi:hypothetical protein